MNVTYETKHKKLSGKQEWLTPPEIITALGEFDLDPCSPLDRPWNTANNHFTRLDNGLVLPWYGRVWCNPPYGKQTSHWLEKCFNHGNCIALTFARTDTQMFFSYVWERANAVLFVKGRIKFFNLNGRQGNRAGAPSVLIAYGIENAQRLKESGIQGKFILLRI